ncbi:MAG: nucleotidyltransferase family protein [Clostridiales bacterium]|nr:nucleotidyltransferase family protein [Candidatus Cacconaster stercorequi]
MRKLRIGCVVMAAGNASRFGANKLAAIVDGKTLIQRSLDAVPTEQFERVVVVTQYPEVAELAQSHGFSPVENQHPDWGISHTISLGLQELSDMDAILFQVSDQPLLSRQSVAGLVRYYRQHPHAIVALGHNGIRGNPCLFPSRFFPELLGLREDHGGNTVIRRHEEDLLLYEVSAQQLTDVDTPGALEHLNQER